MDKRADAVVFYARDGATWVAPSIGLGFGRYRLAASGPGLTLSADANVPLLGDVDGDLARRLAAELLG